MVRVVKSGEGGGTLPGATNTIHVCLYLLLLLFVTVCLSVCLTVCVFLYECVCLSVFV